MSKNNYILNQLILRIFNTFKDFIIYTVFFVTYLLVKNMKEIEKQILIKKKFY